MAATLDTSFKQKIVDSIEIPELTRCCFCFPLRKGLIAFAYVNLVLTSVVACFLSLYMAHLRAGGASMAHGVSGGEASEGAEGGEAAGEDMAEFPRLVVDTAGLVLELAMTVAFIVALHKKHVLLMKSYLYFEIVFSVIGFVYSLACLSRETAGELFLILFQLMIQIYLVILIWSSIVKMERDGTVKYVRDHQTA